MDDPDPLPPTPSFYKRPLFVVLLLLGVVAMVIMYDNSLPKHNSKGRAENIALQVKSAISAYYIEYQRFPVHYNGAQEADFLTDHTLMDVLIGSDKAAGENGLNPRRINFFAGRKAKPMGDGRYRSGIHLDAHGGGELWDPWGNYYHVRIDLDQSDTVGVEEPHSNRSRADRMIPESVIVWSAGKDGIEGTSDDAKTW